MPREDLEQVLDVLLDNATRYAGEGATVVVTAQVRGDEAVVRVEDDGPGVPDDDWDRVTERFWRGSSAEPGSGLGLSIAAALTAARGGELRLGPRPGGGTLAEVRLPVPERPGIGPSVAPPGGSGVSP
ncbi:sensor histidine kinase [Nocardioides ferulae]|uniref:sensor histidine kinase n=1 Tax=Nocardioides ferulae TaxID=2340821 RepID=UPI0013DDBDB3|nr:sensor histidine kinase [Nocardioides ferulae]